VTVTTPSLLDCDPARARAPTRGGRHLVALGLIAAAGLSLVPAAAHAQRPRAAVVIVSEGERDAFIESYLGGVAVNVLGREGYTVVPSEAARAALHALGSECLTSDDCTRRLAASLATPVLLVVAQRAHPEGLSATAHVIDIHVRGLTRGEPSHFTGDEGGAAAWLRDLSSAAARADHGCFFALEAPANTRVRLDGEIAALTRGQPRGFFTGPGDMTLALHASNRAPFRGRASCLSGHAYRIRAR
jgi:hypothetical protein